MSEKPGDTPAIRTRALTKRYGRKTALAGIDLGVPRHVVFGYLGPNGAGKTTTIRILAGLMRPSGGTAEVLGHDVVDQREAAQRCIGYLPGDFVGYPDLTGAQFLTYLAHLRGGVAPAVVDNIAKRLGLDLQVRIGALSHGNRQKVGIIQAFMHEPELLVLDEPTAGLDPLVQREFLHMVREVRESGRTVFLSCHVLSEVEAVADVVAILRNGQLVVTDTVQRLEHQALRHIDLVFGGPPPLAELTDLPGVHDLQVTDRTSASRLKAPPPYCSPLLHPTGWRTSSPTSQTSRTSSSTCTTRRDESHARQRLQELFDLDAMTTAQGFMNAELFTRVLPMLFIVFAVSRGARLIAGEEERGTLDVVLVTPVSTRTLLLQKAAAVAVSVLVLGLVLFATLLAVAPVFDMDLGVADIASGAVAMSLLGIEFGFLSLAVGAATGPRAVALAVGGVLAVGGYVLYALGQIVESVEPWQPFRRSTRRWPRGPSARDFRPAWGRSPSSL
jgi:ABC-2 type transport system ATP-binding protein